MRFFQSKDKHEVNTILAANRYFLKCKLEENCEKSELARKYLTSLIKRTLTERVENKVNTSIIY